MTTPVVTPGGGGLVLGTPLWLSAWIGASPEVRAEPALLTGLAEDLAALLRPYGALWVWTDEPRRYRFSANGWAQLAEALAGGRVRSLAIEATPGRPTGVDGTALVSLALTARPDAALHVGIRLEVSWHVDQPALVAQLVQFVRNWQFRLRAGAAFIADRLEDDALITAHERVPSRTPLVSWAGVRHLLRGLFWGTGLGPDLCARLGGRDRVLADAPVPLAYPIGEGAWLQLSALPPPPTDVIERWARYVSPLLLWSNADLARLENEEHAHFGLWPPPSPPSLISQPVAGRRAPAPLRPRRLLIPVHYLQEPDVNLGINIYLSVSPTLEQQATVAAAVDAWYAQGADGAFGGAGFHDLAGPSHDPEQLVMRWLVDLGSADVRRALRALRRRLADLEGVEVARLAVGTEDVR